MVTATITPPGTTGTAVGGDPDTTDPLYSWGHRSTGAAGAATMVAPALITALGFRWPSGDPTTVPVGGTTIPVGVTTIVPGVAGTKDPDQSKRGRRSSRPRSFMDC